MTVNFRSTLLLCELIYHITSVAQEIKREWGLDNLPRDNDLFGEVYNIAMDYIETYGDYDGDYVQDVRDYASQILSRYFEEQFACA